MTKSIWAGIAGTAAMSVFSYLISNKKKKNFREPDLLAKMVKRVVPLFTRDTAEATGWTLHLTAGITFAAVYYELLKKLDLEPTVLNGLITGGLSGIPAVAIWAAIFERHPHPPKLTSSARKNYYKHLIAAHLVFGAFTFMAFSILQHRKLNA
jgi:hypothetical protein